jgi:hypothetical protein
MNLILQIAFELVLSFMAMDYTLGRATVRDPIRIVIAAIFAVLFTIFVHVAVPGLV